MRHDLARVVAVLGGHHADEEHDALDEARILEVQVDDEALENVLMLLDQVLRELLEELRVPLDDRLLFLAALPLHFIVLFLESMEDVLELISVRQDLNHCAQKPAIDVLDELFAVDIADFLRVLQPQNSRNDVWELLCVHLAEERVSVHVEVLSLVLPQIVHIKGIDAVVRLIASACVNRQRSTAAIIAIVRCSCLLLEHETLVVLLLLGLLDDHLRWLLLDFALFNDAHRTVVLALTLILLVLKMNRPSTIKNGQEVLPEEVNEVVEPVE